MNAPLEPITGALEHLVESGDMVESEEGAGLRRFRFAPSSPEHRRIADELMHLHSDARLTLVQLMSANALERVRGAAMRRLADASRPGEVEEMIIQLGYGVGVLTSTQCVALLIRSYRGVQRARCTPSA